MLFIIAGEQCDRDDPVNAICVAYATTLFTGLLRCAAHDKGGRNDKRKCMLGGKIHESSSRRWRGQQLYFALCTLNFAL